MDERIWTIAEILDQSGPMTADELAAQLKLSGKTVRSLIKTYAKEMQENGFCITAKPGMGFGIEITDAQTYVSGSKPQQGEQTGIPQDAQERIQRLRQYLLEKDGYSKLDDLSEQFFVSRRSISNDLREVERQLAEYGLSIRRKPGYGICVVGRETNRRICIAAQRDESRPVGQQIQELVSRVLEKEKFAMSTMALDNLAVHLEVAVERIRTGHAIESSDGPPAYHPSFLSHPHRARDRKLGWYAGGPSGADPRSGQPHRRADRKHDGRGFSTAGGLLHCYASERQTDVPGKRNDLG